MEIITLCVGSLQENAYLVGAPDQGKAFVVDPGAEGDRIVAESERRGWSIEWIVLTHGHADHFCGTGAVRRATGAKIAGPPGDAKRFADPVLSAAVFLGYEFEPVVADTPLAEGDPWSAIGRTWTVLDTPGHSEGHVSLYSEPDGALFCGDVLFAGSVGRTDLPGGSWEVLARTLREKIFTLPDETRVFPGHGPSTTIGRERLRNPFVHQALTGGPDPTAAFNSFHSEH